MFKQMVNIHEWLPDDDHEKCVAYADEWIDSMLERRR